MKTAGSTGQSHPLDALLYDQTDLSRLCAERSLDWDEYAHMSEFHGNASVLKRYAGLPMDEPLPFAVEHAIPYDLEAAYDYDLKCGLPLFLAVREESAALYRGGPIPEVEAIGFTHLYALDLFARLHPDAPNLARRGTIVFPDKSTLLKETDFDRDAFAATLAGLPDEYQPVVVCVYWRDVLRGNHTPFTNAGLPVVTCGHLRDGDFLLRFHDLCRRFRYACANDIAGSFVLSILSGCHFFHLPGGPLTERLGGRTVTLDRDLSLARPQKTACLAASPFPPASPEPQRALAMRLSGAQFKKSPEEIAALHARAQAALRRAICPMNLTLDMHTPLETWHRLLPVGIDRDSWVRREARLRVPRSSGVAAVRLTMDFRKPVTPEEAHVELELRVQGRTFATMKPPRFHREVLVPCDAAAEETVVEFRSSHAPLVPGELRARALRLTRVELLNASDAAAASQTDAQTPAKRRKSTGAGSTRTARPSLLRRIIATLISRKAGTKLGGGASRTPAEPAPPSPAIDDPDTAKTPSQRSMSSSTADQTRQDLSSPLVKSPNHPAIFFMDGGLKRLVPTPETFNNLFRDWNRIITDISVEDIPDGPMLSHGAALVRPSNSELVYLIDRGTKRAIPSTEVMEHYHFSEKKICVVPPILTDQFPNGKPLAVPAGVA